jgi:probable F420-dependent oxidoreductase
MTGVGLCVPQLGEGLGPQLVREFCRRAEALGYTSLWVQDHFLWPLQPRRGYGGRAGAAVPDQYRSVLSPTELLAAMATWTETVRLGTSILVAGNHWPAQLAGRLATLDVLSGGRLLVGLGVGWSAEEHAACGADIATRGARMDEFVDVLLACWGEDPVAHEGRFFSLPPSVVRPKPVQRPHPPLLSGMWSPAGLERTRLHFDAWNPAGWPVERVAAAVAAMDAGRPADMAPLDVYHRAFAQFPRQPTPLDDPVERLAAEAAAAAAAGFTEFVLEHNFWSGIERPADWLEVPERFLPVVAAARHRLAPSTTLDGGLRST